MQLKANNQNKNNQKEYKKLKWISTNKRSSWTIIYSLICVRIPPVEKILSFLFLVSPVHAWLHWLRDWWSLLNFDSLLLRSSWRASLVVFASKLIDCFFIVSHILVLLFEQLSINRVEDWFGAALGNLLDLFDRSSVDFGKRSGHLLEVFSIVSVILSLLRMRRFWSLCLFILVHQVSVVVYQSLVAWRLSVFGERRSLLSLLNRLSGVV